MILLLIFFLGTAQAQVSTAGLELRLNFDGTGQTVTDSSGSGNDCRLGSTAGADANDPARVSEGLAFDGGDFVDCLRSTFGGTSLFAQESQQFTVQAVARQPADGDAAFVARSAGAVSAFELGSQTGAGVQARLRATGTAIEAPTPTDEWHLWTVRWDGSTASGRLDDGSDATLGVGSSSDPSENLAIGAHSISTGGADFLPNGSQVALVLVYDRALDNLEMREQYCAIRKQMAAKSVSLSDSNCPTANLPLFSGSILVGAPARATFTGGPPGVNVAACETVAAAVWAATGLPNEPFSATATETTVGDGCNCFGPVYPTRS